MKKKALHCRKFDCNEPPHLGGLCKKHHEAETAQRLRRETSIELLHTGMLQRRVVETPALRDELQRVQKWWGKACSAINEGRKDPILLDDDQFAAEWCIGLAENIIDQELAARSGISLANEWMINATKSMLWDRFSSLEAGRMSNGVKRPA